MASPEIVIPRNPKELAGFYEPELYKTAEFSDFDGGVGEEYTLGLMNLAAASYHMLGTRFYTEAGLAFKIPHVTEDVRTANVTPHLEYKSKINMVGNFCTYSIVKIGMAAGDKYSTRALCLTFDDAFLWQHGYRTDDETEFLYVPVRAINDIDQMN